MNTNLKISNVTKIYPGCIANDNVSLEFKSGKIDLYTLRNRASTKQIRDNMSESEKIAYDKKIYANLTEQQLVDKRKRQKKYYYNSLKKN